MYDLMRKDESTRQAMKGVYQMNPLNSNPNGRFQPVPAACGLINVSRNTLMRITAEANAIARFGKSVRIDMPALYEHIEAEYKNGNDGKWNQNKKHPPKRCNVQEGNTQPEPCVSQKDYTTVPARRKAMVYEVLKIGEENALSPEYLKNILHFSSV